MPEHVKFQDIQHDLGCAQFIAQQPVRFYVTPSRALVLPDQDVIPMLRSQRLPYDQSLEYSLYRPSPGIDPTKASPVS